MAVANVAALLAKWGHSVLVVDWDLEAPGLERFFIRPEISVPQSITEKPGIVDLIESQTGQMPVNWRECVHTFKLNGGLAPVSLISAGRRTGDYIDRMQRLDFPTLFSRSALGAYIEELRQEWVANFDFVLIDSRTGVTDIGGICTVHLADVLVLLFTATDSSVDGCLEIMSRAQAARQHLPLDRGRLLAVPLPSRDESRTEYERAADWKKKFARKFESIYEEWLPSKKLIPEVIEILRIPYVPYWSFGERLPAIEESSGDPAGLGYAYQVLARLVLSRLDWNEAIKGHTLVPAPSVKHRHLDELWALNHRSAALLGLKSVSKTGFMEVYHCCVDSPIHLEQDELRDAARQAAVHTFGWPIGIVLDRSDAAPKSTKDGIRVEVKAMGITGGEKYDYWFLSKQGDFYSLMSLFEDERRESSIFIDTRIVKTTEALMHCANLYRILGADSTATVEFRVSYGGLRGRKLTSSGPHHQTLITHVNEQENSLDVQTTFRLDQLEARMHELVIEICSPLFMLFDFFRLPNESYNRWVDNFVADKIV